MIETNPPCGNTLIIGAGGVSSVATQKMAQYPEIFGDLILASRTKSKCDTIAQLLPTQIRTEEIDADDSKQVADMIRATEADLVVNLALPYQDLTIMEGCLKAGAHYLDTANYEPKDNPRFEYRWQWEYQERFKDAGLMALLGSGFDPGVTGVFCAHALKHHFDVIHEIEILDCNGGDNGLPFATNFNPEINIREVTAPARHFENGEWIETPALSHHHNFDFPGVGKREAYLMYHEELESLAKNIPGVQRIRFWMTFSESYLRHLEVLENVGMTRIDPVMYKGQEIIPLQFLKEVLPDPSKLGARTKGKTSIGCLIKGIKDDCEKHYYIYNICDHEKCFEEVGSQAVAYTTGVPAMVGAQMMREGIWFKPGVYNVEEFDPDPFLSSLSQNGLHWNEEINERKINF